jgi:hypothetical protein
MVSLEVNVLMFLVTKLGNDVMIFLLAVKLFLSARQVFLSKFILLILYVFANNFPFIFLISPDLLLDNENLVSIFHINENQHVL